MARRILVFIIFLLFFVFAQDFEYIRSSYQGKDTTLVYLDGKEVLTLLGNDQYTLEKAVSIVSQLQLLGELRYSIKDLKWQKNKNNAVLLWGTEIVTDLSLEEMDINTKKKNDIINLASIFENTSTGGEKIALNNKDNGLIKSMVLHKKDLVSYDGILPAVHAHYPLGTMLRLHNLDTDWTVVIKIIDNDTEMEENVLGVDDNTLKALGVKKMNRVRVEVL